MVQLLIVDSDQFAAAGLREFLTGIPDFEVGEVLDSGVLALEQPPDIRVVGFLAQMSQRAFVERLAARRWPTRILVKGETEQLEEVLAILKAGAHGYFLRGDTPENMEVAIRAVMRRELWVSASLASQLVARLTREEEEEEEEGLKKLSVREVEILRLVEKGMSNKEIAVILGRKLKTVKAHLEHIFKKLEVHNRMVACQVAREQGWLEETRRA
jgi:DNA-binding NarL/FixJ family response regulator